MPYGETLTAKYSGAILGSVAGGRKRNDGWFGIYVPQKNGRVKRSIVVPDRS